MKKEIKFRAWEFDNNGGKLVYGYESGIVKALQDAYPLMQFTGLLDKSGKEIYEGDILKSGNQADEAHPVTIDYYHGLRFMIGKNYLVRADALSGEVIGNIYENPELVKIKDIPSI